MTEDTFLQAEYYGAGATPEEAIANFGLETWSYTDGANNGGKSMYIEGVFGGVAK